MRAFLAVPCDASWVESARNLVGRLQDALPSCAWTRPESWHLTLRFLGQVPEESLRRFAEAIAPAAFQTVPGEIGASGPLLFPQRGSPRVLGVGFSGPGLEDLARLAAEAERAARAIGLPEGKRPFRAHVTFARLKEGWPARAVDDYRRQVEAWSFPAWRARSCVLYESRLERSGAIHTPRAEWTLQGGPRGVRA